jgi:hypothetical protein
MYTLELVELAQAVCKFGDQFSSWYSLGKHNRYDEEMIRDQTQCPELDYFNRNNAIELRVDRVRKDFIGRLFKLNSYVLGISQPKRFPLYLDINDELEVPLMSIVAYNGANAERAWVDFRESIAVIDESDRRLAESMGFKFRQAIKG